MEHKLPVTDVRVLQSHKTTSKCTTGNFLPTICPQNEIRVLGCSDTLGFGSGRTSFDWSNVLFLYFQNAQPAKVRSMRSDPVVERWIGTACVSIDLQLVDLRKMKHLFVGETEPTGRRQDRAIQTRTSVELQILTLLHWSKCLTIPSPPHWPTSCYFPLVLTASFHAQKEIYGY